MLTHAVAPVIKGCKASARPTDDLGGNVLACLHGTLLKASDGIRGGEGEVVTDHRRVGRQEQGEGIAALGGDLKGALHVGVLDPDRVQSTGHDGVFGGAFLIDGNGQPLTARDPLDLTLEGIGDVGEA